MTESTISKYEQLFVDKKNAFLNAVKEIIESNGGSADSCCLFEMRTYFAVMCYGTEMFRVRVAGKTKITEWIVNIDLLSFKEKYNNVYYRPAYSGMGDKVMLLFDDPEDASSIVHKLKDYVLTEYEKCKKGISSFTNMHEPLSDYTVIDIETTGFNINSCEIIELAAAKIRDNAVVDTFCSFVKPEVEIPDTVQKITGITNEMIDTASNINEVLPEFLSFIGDDIILGHNISTFDCKIIERYCDSLNLPQMNNGKLDTLTYSKHCNIDVPDHKLTTLTSYFGIEHSSAHRALSDCIANFECYNKLKELYSDDVKPAPVAYRPKSDVAVDEKVLNKNIESISVDGKIICVTGEFERGDRDSVIEELKTLGADVKSGVSGKTDYLIVGGHGSKDWAFGNYGSKVQKALEYQEKGKNVQIISEVDFFNTLIIEE